jgi:hypothetical protein
MPNFISRSITGIAALAIVVGGIAAGPGTAVAATSGKTAPASKASPAQAAAVASPGIYAPRDVVVGEADGHVDLPVTLDAPGQTTVTVGYSVAGETAYGGRTTCVDSNDAFVNPPSGTLTFAPGVTSQTVQVTLLNCHLSLASGFLTFRFTLSGNSSNSTIVRSSTVVDITGDAAASGTPGLYARDVIVDADAGTVQVPVVLGGPSGAAQGSPVTVHYATSDGSGKAGTDYAASSGTLTFPPGETAQNITIPVLDPAGAAAARSFTVSLDSPSNATIAYGTAAVTIGASGAAAVPSPGISAPADVVAGVADGYVDLPVTLSAPGQAAVTVNFAVSGETAYGGRTSCVAGDGTDGFVNPTSGTLTFAPGVTLRTVRVTLLNCQHSLSYGFYTFRFTLSGNSSNSAIVRAVTSVDLTGDAAAADTPGLYARDVIVDAGAGTVQVPVVLGGPSGAAQGVAVTMHYATSDGSAKAGTDYAATSGTLTFPPGETAQNITIPIAKRAGSAAARNFIVSLDSPSNATVADGTATVKIGASGAAAVATPVISAPADQTVAESAGYVDLPVTLSAPGQATVTVGYAVAGVTAYGGRTSCVENTDAFVNPASGTLTFTPGMTLRTVRVTLLNCDTLSPLTFSFKLSSAAGATIGGTGVTTVTIVNPATVPGAPTAVTATSGGSQSATVSFTAPAANGGDPVNYYTVTASPGGQTATGTGSPITVTGLTDGTAYTFTVTATNSVGTGPASAPSNSVSPGVSVPGAPTALTATAGNTKVTLAWTAPATNGGSAITGYWVYVGTASGAESATPVNQAAATAASYAVTGLTDGTKYYFKVKAQNAAGTSAASNEASAIPSPVNFTAKPGTATDISAGANGSVWSVGTATVSGGHPVQKWSGSKWTTVSGAAIAIAVDTKGNPWIINSSHKISHWNGSKFVAVTGTATDISVGATGTVWAVGTVKVIGGFQVLKWSGTKWSVVSGAGAVAIAVDTKGNPFIITSAHAIERWTGSKWGAFTGTATDIAVGKNGTIWDVGATSVSGGFPVYRWNGSSWVKSSAAGVKVAVDPNGLPWIVTASHTVYFG